MKHPQEFEIASGPQIRDALQSVGVQATAEQCEQMREHTAYVLETNRTMNLTRIAEAEAVLNLHIVDSLAFLPHVGELRGPVLDLGSGAGYPGVPLAIMGYDVTLCESTQKKARFLASVIENLGLSTHVEPRRAEELSPLLAGGFNTVVARAVAQLPSLVELAAPLLCTGGLLLALKGVPEPAELDAGTCAAVQCGMRQVNVVRYALPSAEQRTLVVYEEVGAPAMKLPRRPGLAQSQPLGAI